MYKFGGYKPLYKARSLYYGERLSSLSSSAIGGYMAAGWHTVEVMSVALYKDSFDMKLVNSFGDMHRQRIWPYDKTGKPQYITHYMLKFAELNADKILADPSDLSGFYDLVGAKFRVQIRWQPFGYRIYSNGDQYYVVDGRGKKLTEDFFSEIRAAREWASKRGIKPAYKEIARYASAISIARSTLFTTSARK